MRSQVLIATLGVLSLAPSAASAGVFGYFNGPITPTACREEIMACQASAGSQVMNSVRRRLPAPSSYCGINPRFAFRAARGRMPNCKQYRLTSTTGTITVSQHSDHQIQGAWSNHRPPKFVRNPFQIAARIRSARTHRDPSGRVRSVEIETRGRDPRWPASERESHDRGERYGSFFTQFLSMLGRASTSQPIEPVHAKRIHRDGMIIDPMSQSWCPHQRIGKDGYVSQLLARLHPYPHRAK